MNGEEFLQKVQAKIADEENGRVTDAMIATRLGITAQAVGKWRVGEITARQMAAALFRMEELSVRRAVVKAKQEATRIRPIVEFLKIYKCESRHGARYEIFKITNEEGNELPYMRGLRMQLEKHRGLYIFHDSRGRALYAGRATKQKLWNEINNAYNRDRSVQQIRRVEHPTERPQEFRTFDEKRRQIRLKTMPLHEIASYISAYEVAENLIGELESLLIRCFPNDLLNVRMENFTWDVVDEMNVRPRKRKTQV